MGLYKELDWWSILEKIYVIMDGSNNKCFCNSEYAGEYQELLTELANAAGDIYCDYEKVINDIWMHGIPYRTRIYTEKDSNTENAAFWFNAVALTLTDTDMENLFYKENNFEDYEREREKRINALERLSKKDFMWIMQTVCNLIIKYLELCGAWDAIVGTIDELDSRQAFIKDKDGLREPKSSYL